jgi:predicted aldo/keto reductase-like oxidoreductase
MDMQYRPFGNNGVQISALGFGAMRLPMRRKGRHNHVRVRDAVRMLREAFELGVNYVDTAYGYCAGESEIVVGKALKSGWRDKIMLSTKCPTWEVKKRSDFRRLLDEQLRKLDVECIDFYHMHGIGANAMEKVILKHKVFEEAEKAKKKGLIRHLSFSFHDKPENMKAIIDTGAFASVLCQYNLLDRSNEKMIAYAAKKGLGVVVMGPVGGGRLGQPSKVIQKLLPKKASSSPELALRFVLANPNVSCALSGMSTPAHVEENARVASNEKPLTAREQQKIIKAMDELKNMAKLYCTGCGYCLPCPQDVDIPGCFEAMNYYRVYGLLEAAQQRYNRIGRWGDKTKKRADACVECGKCEDKCPQHIKIRKQLREVRKLLGKAA